MSARAFAKYEGLGNDFVVVDLAREDDFDLARAPSLCDRRLGVGADGVLLVLPARPGSAGIAARMRVVNADGSTPEMCGNGLRCVALHLARARGEADADLVIETDAGARLCRVRTLESGGVTVEVAMGDVRVVGERRLAIDGHDVGLTLVDAGNPHAIVTGCAPYATLGVLGPAIARHASFPEGTNVEMVAARDGELDVVVWERGVGPTLACGTGACAAVAYATGAGIVPRDEPIRVRLPGGTLVVTLDARTGATRLEGPARLVFHGELTQGAPLCA